MTSPASLLANIDDGRVNLLTKELMSSAMEPRAIGIQASEEALVRARRGYRGTC